MDDLGPLPPSSAAVQSQRGSLHVALTETRKSWRWHWQCFWLLRWENTLRRPAWRVEEESKAWRRMREEVCRYATLRAQIRDVQRSADDGSAVTR